MRGSPTARRTLDRALEFFGRGNEHFDSDRFSGAADCYRRARDEFVELDDRHAHIEYIYALTNLALCLTILDEHSKADEAYQFLLEELRRCEESGMQDRLSLLNDRVVILTNLAILLLEEDRPVDAEAALGEALSILEEIPGDDIVRGRVILRLAVALTDQERLAEAEPLCREALDVFEQGDDCGIDLGRCLMNLGIIEMERGRLPESISSFNRSLAVLGSLEGSGWDQALASINLGNAQRKYGRFADAEQSYRRALEMCDRIEGMRLDRVHAEQNLALVLMDQGKWEESEKLYAKALDEYAALGACAVDRARTTMNLAMTLFHQDRLEEAESRCRQALELLDESEGSRSLAGGVWLNLANTLREQHRLADAENGYRRALREFDGGEGGVDNHALTVLNLAVTVADQNRYSDAFRLFAEARRRFTSLGLRFEMGIVDREEAETRLRLAREADDPDERPRLLNRALTLAIGAAMDVDHRRFQFPDERSRITWIDRVARPSMDFALTIAAEANDAALISELIATWRTAGIVSVPQEDADEGRIGGMVRRTPLRARSLAPSEEGGPSSFVETPPSPPPESLDAGGFFAEKSTAWVRRSTGPRLILPFDGRIALSAFPEVPAKSANPPAPSSRYR